MLTLNISIYENHDLTFNKDGGKDSKVGNKLDADG